ncbi:MAG TPA: hypothetical protein VK996_08885 [Ramlibacter sp.]|nr:hypothetical protein [Ramlibacter sp.]
MIQFRHADLDDRFARIGNFVFVLIRSWGVAVFCLMIAGIPAGFLMATARPKLGDRGVAWMVGLWLGVSVPIAMYYAWRYWNRVTFNRFIVDGSGIEYLNFPQPAKRIPWSEIRVIRDTADPDDDDTSSELIFETARGKFEIAEGWQPGIQAAVEKYFRVTKRESKKARK